MSDSLGEDIPQMDCFFWHPSNMDGQQNARKSSIQQLLKLDSPINLIHLTIVHRFCWGRIKNSPILTHLLFPGRGLLLLTLSLKIIILDPNQKIWPIQKTVFNKSRPHIPKYVSRDCAGQGTTFQPTNSEVVRFSSASTDPTFTGAKCLEKWWLMNMVFLLLQLNMLASKQIHQCLYIEWCHYYVPEKEHQKTASNICQSSHLPMSRTFRGATTGATPKWVTFVWTTPMRRLGAMASKKTIWRKISHLKPFWGRINTPAKDD